MSYHDAMESVLSEVRAERERQHTRWGSQRPDWAIWLAILMEEVGESAEAALKAQYEGAPLQDLRDEMVQVAAVAVAMLEHLDEVLNATKQGR
jgi:NTP pyrophosphatase (non-canonical NTP hydrolase)